MKGFPAPVSVYCVTGETGAANRFEARAQVGLNPIIGRDAELRTLLGRWKIARSGTGQVALVCGEPGMGKSRLARAIMEAVAGGEPQIMRWYAAALDALERFAETGTVLCQTNLHAPLCELLIRAGQPQAAAVRLDEMIPSATRRVERVYLSALYRVRGLARHALGDRQGARADPETACGIAREQGALTLLRRAEGDLGSVLPPAGIAGGGAAG